MFLFQTHQVPKPLLENMISNLIRATVNDPVRAKTERIRRASFYEEYAQRCLRGAFPDEIPTPEELAQRGLSTETVEAAMRATWRFRDIDLLPSEVALECRWMLEGYAGIQSYHRLGFWEWKEGRRAHPVSNRPLGE